MVFLHSGSVEHSRVAWRLADVIERARPPAPRIAVSTEVDMHYAKHQHDSEGNLFSLFPNVVDGPFTTLLCGGWAIHHVARSPGGDRSAGIPAAFAPVRAVYPLPALGNHGLGEASRPCAASCLERLRHSHQALDGDDSGPGDCLESAAGASWPGA